ncbi:TPR_REGION domain-containing protein [Bacillus pseudomycoides]
MRESEGMAQAVSLQDLCKELEKEELIALVKHLADQYMDIDMAVMEWYALQKGTEKKAPVSNKLLWEYWDRAEAIISDFNDYGGGPEHLEYDVYEYLEKMTDVLSQYSISTEEKKLLINRVFTQYAIGNSGFDDVLMDKIYEICYDSEMYEEILEVILDTRRIAFESPYTNFDDLADKLIDKYPREIIEYYWIKGCLLIQNGNRKRYKQAIKHFEKVKDIYETKLQEQDVWKKRLEALKIQHKTKRALLDELRVIE